MTLPQAVWEGILEDGRQKSFPFSSSSAAYLRAFVMYELFWSLREVRKDTELWLHPHPLSRDPSVVTRGMDVHVPLGSACMSLCS